MGGTSIEQPQPPAQPSTAEAVQAWVDSMPKVYETQMKYAPQEAAQQVALAQQYAQPLGEAYLQAQKAMYPEEYALRDELMQQAKEGMNSQMPDWYKNQWSDYYKSMLGENALSGSGADYYSTAMLQQQNDWQNQYKNMALSLSGSQPIFQAQAPGYSNYMSGFTPGQNMNFMSSTYAPYASAYSSMYNTNAQMAMNDSNMPFKIMGGVGNMMGGLGGMATGFGWGGS